MNVPFFPFHKRSRLSFWAGAFVLVLLQQQAPTCLGAGTVQAWGANDSLQVRPLPDMANAVAVAGGAAHSMALLQDGSVRAWGLYTSGQTNVAANLVASAMSAGSTF